MRKIWIDNDAGIDDTLALILALNSPELEILGITTVAGNVNVEKGTKNVLNFLEIYEKIEIPVFKGSKQPLKKKLEDAEHVHGKDGLGNLFLMEPEIDVQKKNYLDALNEAINANPKEIIIITLGPLTNIARFIEKYPDSIEKIKGLIIMGGAFFVSGNVTQHAEFNIFVDAEAADIVIKSPITKVFFGLDVTRKHQFEKDFLESLEARNSERPTFKYVLYLMNYLIEKGYNHLHDPIALLYVIDDDIYELKEHPINVITKGRKYGKTFIDENSKNISYICVDINIENVKQHFLKLLT